MVSSLEEAYGYGTQNGEKAVVKPELEGLNFSVSVCNANVETLML